MPESNFHNITIENRRKITIAGVKDIESFNESDIVVITHSGGLRIKGKGLEISRISVESGELEMAGQVSCLQYSDHDRTPNNIITKLFR